MEQFKAQYRVYYEDTDAGGVVYYANYLKFAERARTDYLRARGIEQTALQKEEGLVFVVHRVEATFHKPAKLDDLLDVSVEVKELKGATIHMEQAILRGAEKLCSVKVEVICVQAAGFKPARIPEALKAKF